MAPKAPSSSGRAVVVDGRNIAKNFGARRVLFDTGFGFRVQIDLVPARP